MQFEQIDVTGSRIIGSITPIGHTGPKHHGIILGKYNQDQEIYIAESMDTGYQLSTYKKFNERYLENGHIEVIKNTGEFSDFTVAKRALDEIKDGGKGTYNLLTNNCESFANRATHGHSTSNQIINTAIGIVVLIGTAWFIKQSNKA